VETEKRKEKKKKKKIRKKKRENKKNQNRLKKKEEEEEEEERPIKEAKVAHIVLALCWPITCIRPLWYCFKPRPISTHC